MGYPEFRVIEEALDWDPADVTVPAVPDDAVYVPGVDPIGILVNAVMPDIAADVNQHVANTRGREERFADNLRSARSAYHGTDVAGQDQIDSAASKIDPAGAFGAGSPAQTIFADPASPGGAPGFAQLTQMMGIAMQGVQQALQAPVQAVGMAGQMAQPIMQGVQGISQQPTRATGTAGETRTGEPISSDAGDGSEPGLPAALEAIQTENENNVSSENDNRLDEGKTAESEAGAETAHGSQAPVGASQTEPGLRRMTETAPEVAL